MTLIHSNRRRILAAVFVPLLVFSLAAPSAFAETHAGSGILPWPRQIASGSE